MVMKQVRQLSIHIGYDDELTSEIIADFYFF